MSNEMQESRRKFIQQSALATLGFAIVPRFVLGGEGFIAPSDKLNLGFIGAGKQSRSLLNSFKDKANIIAAADVDLNKVHYFHSLLQKYNSTVRPDKTGLKGFVVPQ